MTITFNLLEIGMENCIPQKYITESHKGFPVLHLVLKNQGYIKVNNETHLIQRGGMFLLPPYVKTTYYPDKKKPWTYIWVGIEGEFFLDLLKDIGITPDHPFINKNKERGILEIFSRMAEATSYPSPQKEEAISGLLLILLSSLARTRNQKFQETNKHFFVEKTKNFILNNYNFPIGIDEITNDIGLSRSYLSKIFKDEEKISMIDYLINLRIDKAKLLLETTSLPIPRIGKEVGLDDPAYFSALFKKKTGLSPLNYRKTKRK